jgi:hypothetical protein
LDGGIRETDPATAAISRILSFSYYSIACIALLSRCYMDIASRRALCPKQPNTKDDGPISQGRCTGKPLRAVSNRMLPLFIIAAPEKAARTAMATATIAIAREIIRDSRTSIPYNTSRDSRFKDCESEKKNHDMDSWVWDKTSARALFLHCLMKIP